MPHKSSIDCYGSSLDIISVSTHVIISSSFLSAFGPVLTRMKHQPLLESPTLPIAAQAHMLPGRLCKASGISTSNWHFTAGIILFFSCYFFPECTRCLIVEKLEVLKNWNGKRNHSWSHSPEAKNINISAHFPPVSFPLSSTPQFYVLCLHSPLLTSHDSSMLLKILFKH